MVRPSAAVLSCLLLASGAAGAEGRSDPCSTPSNLLIPSREQGQRTLHLDDKLGFTRLTNQVRYFIDPRLADSESELYGPEKNAVPDAPGVVLKSLKDAGFTLGADEKRRAKILGPINQATEEFLKLASERPPEPWSDLKDFLTRSPTLKKRDDQLWVTLAFRFWVRERSGEKDLQCRMELRAFKAKIDYAEQANLVNCELVFRNTSIGTVPLECPGKVPEETVRAVIINALRNRIAVNFCLNRSLRLEDDQRESVLGRSINEVQR
jgi:hypothetical protein